MAKANTKAKNVAKAPAKKVVSKSEQRRVAELKKAPAKKVAVNRTKRAPVEAPKLIGTKGKFGIEVELNDEVIKGKTDDIARAVQSIAPAALSTKLVLRFWLASAKKENRKVVEKVLMIPMARRVFVNTMSADLLAKSVKMALGYNDEGSK